MGADMDFFKQVNREFLRRRAALKWGAWGPDVLSLSVADLDFPAPEFIKEGVRKALDEDRAPYASLHGDPDVLAAAAEKVRRVNGIPVGPEDVAMVPGTMFAIWAVTQYALRPGDEALICPSPVYPHFMKKVAGAGGAAVHHSLTLAPEGARLDLAGIEARITPRTRLIMLCNPHNPCGVVLTRPDLEALVDLAIRHNLVLFSDELYEDMIFEGTHLSPASFSDQAFETTLTVFGFSKAYGFPGFRIAYVVGHGPHIKAIRQKAYEILVHTDTLAQAAALAALTHGGAWLKDLRAHLVRMRDLGLERLRAMPGVWCPTPQASPFLFPNFSAYGKTSAEMYDYLLKEAKVVLETGSDFGPAGEGHLRINFATSPDVLTEALDRIESALAKLERRG
jgi:aspartate/methionine/tyrosine aminotransferase